MAIAGFPILDAHTHVFPPDVTRNRAAFATRDPWFDQLYRDPRAAIIGGDELLAAMDGAGVAQAVVCGFPWRDPAICSMHNDYLAETSAASAGRLAWLATVPPALAAPAALEAERSFSLGAAGLGELNADAQAFDLTTPCSLRPVIEICLANERPILLHASEPVGHPYPGKGRATPDRLLTFVTAYPELSVVLAHWGGGLPFYELMPEVAAATARVVYDSAASTYLYRPRIFRAVLDVVGPHRVLFASDHPVLRMDRILRRVIASGDLLPDEIAPVLGDNARRIYKLAPPDPAAIAPAPREDLA